MAICDRHGTKHVVGLVVLCAMLAMGALVASATAAGAASYQLDGLGASCTEPGSSNTVHGNGFTGGSDVNEVLGSAQVGTLVADSSGVVDGSFTVPSNFATGPTSLDLVGPGANGQHTITLNLQVGNCAVSTGAAEASRTIASGTGALAFTGGSTGMIVGIAVALLLLGGALVVAVRRRQHAEHV